MRLRSILAILFFGFVVGCGTKPLPKDGSGDVHGAWAYMQLFVEDRLNSPKSADFPFGGSKHVIDLGHGRYEVNSYVDSDNLFGANIRTQFKGIIRKGNGQWYLDSLDLQ